jgi:hypothetical protein
MARNHYESLINPAFFVYSSILKMETMYSPETLTYFYYTIRCHISYCSTLVAHCRENVETDFIVVYYYYYYYYRHYLIELKMGLYPVAMELQWDTTHKNTHVTQNNTPRSNRTQSYTNNKRHISHNKYNTKKKWSYPCNRPWRPVDFWCQNVEFIRVLC